MHESPRKPWTKKVSMSLVFPQERLDLRLPPRPESFKAQTMPAIPGRSSLQNQVTNATWALRPFTKTNTFPTLVRNRSDVVSGPVTVFHPAPAFPRAPSALREALQQSEERISASQWLRSTPRLAPGARAAPRAREPQAVDRRSVRVTESVTESPRAQDRSSLKNESRRGLESLANA